MAETTRGRYNVLVLTCDQHNAHLPRPPGYELPNHDRLEARGLVFDDFQVGSGLCTPSRSVMWTGQHAPLTGMWDNTNMAWIDDMDPATRTVGHMLRDAGYYTAFKGKWHLSEIPGTGTEDALEPYGFSDFQGFGEVWGEALDGYERDGDIAADAEAWLTRKAPDIAGSQPWFLAVNFCNPHDIMYYDADPSGETQTDGLFPLRREPDDEIYAKRWETTLPASFDDPLTGHPTAARTYMHANEIAFGDMPHGRHDMWHRYINYYLNCIRDVDRHIGTVLDALEASGQADDTIIIFTADHGDMLAAHGMRQKGTVPFKEAWNVPFVVVHPEHDGGGTTQAVGSSVDIVPTILELAGVSEEQRRVLHPQLKGEDLSSLLTTPDAAGPRGSSDAPGKGCLMTYDTLSQIDFEFVAEMAAVTIDLGDAAEDEAPKEQPGKLQRARDLLGAVYRADFSQRNVLRGVYDGRYKFVRFFAINEHNQPETLEELYRDNDVALYDLGADPDEMINLADPEHPMYDSALVTSMNTKLHELIAAELGSDPNLVDRPLETFVVAGLKSRRK
jgi:arylsulfatase